MRSQSFIPSTTLTLLALAQLGALESGSVGPRALGMGGAGVAVADDQTVQWQNPAALGFFGREPQEGDSERVKGNPEEKNRVSWTDNNNLGRKDFGFGLDLTFGARFDGNMRNELIAFSKEVDEIERLSNVGIQTQKDVDSLLRIINSIDKLDDDGNAVRTDLNAGFAVRVGHFAIGVRNWAEGAFRVRDIDTRNLGLADIAGSALADQINSSGTGGDGQILLFTPGQQAELLALLGDDANARAALERLDFQARQQNLTQADIARLYPYLTSITANLGGDLRDNTTAFRVAFFDMIEVPISYGIPINQYFSVGFNLKYMNGTVGGAEIRVKDFASDSNSDSKYAYSYRRSHNFGVDLALMGRYKWIQGGLVGTNLNAPRFAAPGTKSNGISVNKVTVDPQVRLGLAFVPFETVAITGDLDLLQTKSVEIGHKSQQASLGAELDLPASWWRFLALRGGLSQNLADSGDPLMYHAGLGLDLYALRLDLAASIDETSAGKLDKYVGYVTKGSSISDMDDLPKGLKVSFQLAVDF